MVGPEGPLCAGVADDLEAAGIRTFGPSKGRHGWKAPRASPRTCARPTTSRPRPTSASRARQRRKPTCAKKARRSWSRPTVLPPARASSSQRRSQEAEAAIDMMFGGGLGERAWEIVIEECLVGEEAWFFALCDGETAIAAGVRTGPQARLRRRQGTQHRRHGRLFAGAGHDGCDERAGDAGNRHADRARHGGAGRALQGRAVRRVDDHQRWPATHRIQCPLRRSGMPGDDAAAEVGPACQR